jgi:hypothetical protein
MISPFSIRNLHLPPFSFALFLLAAGSTILLDRNLTHQDTTAFFVVEIESAMWASIVPMFDLLAHVELLTILIEKGHSKETDFNSEALIRAVSIYSEFPISGIEILGF